MKPEPFLLVFSQKLGAQQTVVDALDRIPEIPFWYAPFAHVVFFTSTLGAHELGPRIHELIPGAEKAQWVVVQIDTTKAQGRLTLEAWRLINEPQSPELKDKSRG